MKEKIFKVSGRFEQDGLWSDLPEDFIGYLLLDTKTHIFIGYMEEQYDSPYDNERYITGLLFEEDGITKFTFLKLVNERSLSPIMYAFSDISKEGYWSAYSMVDGFAYPDGKAIVVLEEVEKTEDLEDKISATYAKIFEGRIPWNFQLSKGAEGLVDFVEGFNEDQSDKPADVIATEGKGRYEALCKRINTDGESDDEE